jgi:glycosyltransferase involved in cell wall biosynthesis
VTILLPTYKRPEKLRRAIQSVLDQTYSDIRVLVFDNASFDGTREVVEKLIVDDPRIEYHCHAENIGAIENFNFAVSRVTTPYFGFLTDDDYFLPNFAEDAMHAFRLHPAISLSVLSAPTVDETGKVVSDQLANWPREGAYAPGESIEKAVAGQHPILTMCLFRQELSGEVQFDKNASWMADVPVIISLLAKYPFYLSKRVGGYFIRHAEALGESFSTVENACTLCSAFLWTESRVQNDLAIDPKVRAKIVRGLKRRIDRVFLGLLLQCLRTNNAEAFQYVYGKILDRSPSFWQCSGVLTGLLARIIGQKFVALASDLARKAILDFRR